MLAPPFDLRGGVAVYKGSLLFAALAVCASTARAAPIPADKIFEAPIGRFQQGQPGKPAILLVHATNCDQLEWTEPAGESPIQTQWFYDHQNTPAPYIDDDAKSPGAGIHTFGVSNHDKAATNRKNWWDFLVKQGFTVATWSQPLPLFAGAYASAETAYAEFLRRTGTLPVALIGHSRGGLLVRKLLLEKGAQGRVKWVVTMGTPHHGTNWGKLVHQVRTETNKLLHPSTHFPHPKFRGHFLAAIKSSLGKFVDSHAGPEYEEQRPDSPLIKDLNARDKKLDGVSYYTFGGSSTRFMRFYVWEYTKASVVPHKRGKNVTYRRRAEPKEISLVSPMWDKLPNPEHYDEMSPGKGDVIVSDASARLPWSKHKTVSLNHAEMLFNEALQREVAALLH
jgi:pimeloyl-ACP methyl ester carboxylesterase